MVTMRDIIQPGLTGTVRDGFGTALALHSEPVLKAWRAACFAYSRRVGAEAGTMLPACAGQNFHVMSIGGKRGSGEVEVLLHALLPFMGVRSTGEGRFIDAIELEAPQGLVMLPGEMLNGRFVREAWMEEELDAAAWRDILHWKPGTVGELVFNGFD